MDRVPKPVVKYLQAFSDLPDAFQGLALVAWLLPAILPLSLYYEAHEFCFYLWWIVYVCHIIATLGVLVLMFRQMNEKLPIHLRNERQVKPSLTKLALFVVFWAFVYMGWYWTADFSKSFIMPFNQDVEPDQLQGMWDSGDAGMATLAADLATLGASSRRAVSLGEVTCNCESTCNEMRDLQGHVTRDQSGSVVENCETICATCSLHGLVEVAPLLESPEAAPVAFVYEVITTFNSPHSGGILAAGACDSAGEKMCAIDTRGLTGKRLLDDALFLLPGSGRGRGSTDDADALVGYAQDLLGTIPHGAGKPLLWMPHRGHAKEVYNNFLEMRESSEAAGFKATIFLSLSLSFMTLACLAWIALNVRKHGDPSAPHPDVVLKVLGPRDCVGNGYYIEHRERCNDRPCFVKVDGKGRNISKDSDRFAQIVWRPAGHQWGIQDALTIQHVTPHMGDDGGHDKPPVDGWKAYNGRDKGGVRIRYLKQYREEAMRCREEPAAQPAGQAPFAVGDEVVWNVVEGETCYSRSNYPGGSFNSRGGNSMSKKKSTEVGKIESLDTYCGIEGEVNVLFPGMRAAEAVAIKDLKHRHPRSGAPVPGPGACVTPARADGALCEAAPIGTVDADGS